MLRLRLGPSAALEIAEEGPGSAARSRLIERFDPRASRRELALAVFVSDGCHVCDGARARRSSRSRPIRCRGRAASTRRRDAAAWAELASRAARTRSPSTSRAPCSPRARSTTSLSSRASSPPPSDAARRAPAARRLRACLTATTASASAEALESIAGNTSRRGFLARVGGAMTAITAGGLVGARGQARRGRRLPLLRAHLHDRLVHPPVRPGAAADRLTTASRSAPATGMPIDNLGRLVNSRGEPVDDNGKTLRDPDGRPLPPAPRTKICERDRAALRLQRPNRRQLVSLLRRTRAQARSTAARTSTSASTATRR